MLYGKLNDAKTVFPIVFLKKIPRRNNLMEQAENLDGVELL